jgi:hypothetical protein
MTMTTNMMGNVTDSGKDLFQARIALIRAWRSKRKVRPSRVSDVELQRLAEPDEPSVFSKEALAGYGVIAPIPTTENSPWPHTRGGQARTLFLREVPAFAPVIP